MKSTPTTYSEAAGPIACTQGGAASPFIIDLPPDQRGDVELAMRQLVAVENDCEKLVLLPDCEISGEYQYAGLTPREQVISIGDDFEVRANLRSEAFRSPVKSAATRRRRPYLVPT